jgi:hypothetical protein
MARAHPSVSLPIGAPTDPQRTSMKFFMADNEKRRRPHRGSPDGQSHGADEKDFEKDDNLHV